MVRLSLALFALDWRFFPAMTQFDSTGRRPVDQRWPTSPGIADTQLAGTTLGGFQVLGRIGHGGMGAVYLARKVSLAGIDRLYALKVMHQHLTFDDGAVAMMIDEASAAARVHHPNMLAVESLEEDSGRLFLVMQYVEGCTFGQLLKRTPEFRDPARVLSVVLDALEGLHAAHNAIDYSGRPLEVVHRDFTPENILVGIDGVARVADFGIAKTALARATTSPGAHKGKYAYMSPEQLIAGPTDRRSDLFSAGIVLYNALTGTKLFVGGSDPKTMTNILEQPVEPPSQVGLRPNAGFDRICLRALERDREKRYQSAAEMAADLRAAARECGVVPSRAPVANWVRIAFGRQLAERWQVVRSLIATLPSEPPAKPPVEIEVAPPVSAPSVSMSPPRRRHPRGSERNLPKFDA